MKKSLLFLAVFSALVAACSQEPSEEEKAKQAAAQARADEKAADEALLEKARSLFKALPAVATNPVNPISNEKVELGHMLYFDTRLSLTGNNSCNSCHDLAKWGVDNESTSLGDAGKRGDRNSPTSLNAALHSVQFWDGRAADVEEQAGMPILNPVEMAIPSKDFLVRKLKGIPMYAEMFKKAFPNDSDPLTYQNIQNAIAAFERKLIIPSRFDTFLGGDLKALSRNEKDGLNLFIETGCATCHNGALLGGTMLQKFGVHGDYRDFTKSKVDDIGLMTISKKEFEKDVFKVPSLRNIEKTWPYFHDGSITDLAEAVDIMAKLQLNKEISKEENQLIVAFLGSLTGIVPAEYQKAPANLAPAN
ncbi:MAG: cytochrome-c peroxidase [Flavobacteriales bacterium]